MRLIDLLPTICVHLQNEFVAAVGTWPPPGQAEKTSASPDLHSEFLSAVIGAMDASEDLSAQILNNPDLSQKLLAELVPIVYKGLRVTA